MPRKPKPSLNPEDYPYPRWHVDIINGAVRGDYARRLGIPGRVTQAVLAFVPGIGSICAFRDYFACRRKRDRTGATLNLIAIFPFFGGFPKTVAVVRGASNMTQVVLASHAVVQDYQHHRDDVLANLPLAGLIAPHHTPGTPEQGEHGKTAGDAEGIVGPS